MYRAKARPKRSASSVWRILAAAAMLAGMLQVLLPASIALAVTISSASFSGGDGTANVGGALYAKQGASLTLTVNTSSETKCVQISGAFSATQAPTAAQSTWTFSFTAGDGDGARSVAVTAGAGYNGNSCTTGVKSTSASFVLDNTRPVVTASVSSAPNAAGWNNSDVTITWSATDVGSGVASGPTPATDSQTDNTAGVAKTATATDRLGNEGSGSVTVKLDKSAPTITGSRSPAANGFGWNNTDVTVSFSCSDSPSGIKSCTGPTTLSNEGANQSVSGTATDNADNTAIATVSGINIDKTAPSLSGAPTTSPNANGWYNGNVTIHWTCGDTLSGPAGPCPADSTLTGEGTGLTTGTSVSDKAGNTTNATSSPAVNIDKTEPTTTATAPSNWNNTDVGVSLNASDGLSGVAATYYTLDGGAQQSGTSVSISAEGTHTLQFWSVDKAGNAETAKSVTVKIDKTPPTINHTLSPAANANGWNNTDVTVSFSCTDALSGVASCTGDQTVTTEGASQLVTGASTDNAGNTATDPATVSIDKTAPTITGAADRAANDNGWYDANVTVSFTCDDALSGVASCAGPQTLGEGANQSASGSATDAAGNTASASVSGIKIDKTAPSLSGAATTAPNAAGWYSGDVTIHWTCSDALSDIDGSCPADDTLTGEGNNLSASASVSDKAGNTTSKTVSGIQIDRTAPTTQASAPDPLASGWYASGVTVTLNALDSLSGVASTHFTVDGGMDQTGTSVLITAAGVHTVVFWSVDNAGNVEDSTAPGHSLTIKIDGTPPTISGSAAPGPNAAGWNNTDVTVSFTCSDAESGVAECSDAQTLTTEGANQSVKGTAKDYAGNSADYTVSGINIDKTAPTTTATAPASWTNSDVTVSLSATDNLSGVAATYYKVNGGTEQTGDSIPFSAEGTYTLEFWSVDNAGNVEDSTAPGHSLTIKIDGTPPTISGSAAPGPNAAGWNNTDVTVSFTCSDTATGSGIASCTAAQTVSTEGASQSVTGAATDKAGNSADYTVSGINIDKTGPTNVQFQGITANAKFLYGNVPTQSTLSCTADDALSGLASCAISGYSAAVGPHTLTATATDKAGNQTAATLNYEVVAPLVSDIRQPVDAHASPTDANLSAFKIKSVLPIKFQLIDPVTEAVMTSPPAGSVAKLTFGKYNSNTQTTDTVDAVSVGSANSGSIFRWSGAPDYQFVYNLATNGQAAGTYFVQLTLCDANGATIAQSTKQYFILK